MLFLQGVTYAHPNRDVLFSDINLTVNRHEKIALIGNNGAGKSTLLRILAGKLKPATGIVGADSGPYLVPQHFGQYNHGTVAEALGIQDKLLALKEILDGHLTDINLELLDDDWGIEERCQEAFAHWELDGLPLSRSMSALSGGQKTRVFLAGIMIHEPEIVLMDEPSNHLDAAGRDLLYSYIRATPQTLVVVSHDRTLLNLLSTVCELGRRGITVYGGNYDFYAAQKEIAAEALNNDLKAREKALRKAREVERESMERQQKLDARGKKKQEKAGLPTIVQNAFRNNAEKSTARMKGVHADKVDGMAQELSKLRGELPLTDKMKVDFNHSALHRGKILVQAENVNFAYGDAVPEEHPLGEHPLGEHPLGEHPLGEHPLGEHPLGEHPLGEHPLGEHPLGEHPLGESPLGECPPGEQPLLNPVQAGSPLWKQPLDFRITSGERIVIRGANGSGKTTLIRMLLNSLKPTSGTMQRADFKSVYIDQDYSLIDNRLTVYEQAQQFNAGALQEHDIRTRLNRFLFTKEYWDKTCIHLSGGEKMRLMLCSLSIANQSPDVMVLDEPTNNLDIQNIEILTAAINEYRGTLIVVSHDARFLADVQVEREIVLN